MALNYYEHHLGDYAKDAGHLSLTEEGAYRRLLDAYYIREEPLPADLRECCKLARAGSKADREAVAYVLKQFFALRDDGHHQQRADGEIERYRSKRDKARVSAQASVVARRERSDVTNRELRAARMAAAREKGTHTDEEWAALMVVCGAHCVRCGVAGPVVRDHILPVYQGGSDSIDNIQPLCAACNSAKGPESTDHRPSDWRASVERTLKRPLSERRAPHTHERAQTGTGARPSPVPNHQSPPTEAELPRTARASRLDPTWDPGESGFAYAKEVGLANGRAHAELLNFRDHWTSKPGREGLKLDWMAAWRMWCRRSLEFAGSKDSSAGDRSWLDRGE